MFTNQTLMQVASLWLTRISINEHLQDLLGLFEYASDFFSAIRQIVCFSNKFESGHDTITYYYDFIRRSLFLWILFLPFHLLILILIPFFKISGIVAKAISNVVGVDEILSPGTHVPAFYCPSSSYQESLLFFTIIPLFGAIFGGLHCLAWNFVFPSEVEELIWKVASLTVLFTPVLPLLVFPLEWISDFFRHGRLTGLGAILSLIAGFLQLSFYVLARLTLLMEAVVLLRQQPATAFQAINWSTFIPHF